MRQPLIDWVGAFVLALVFSIATSSASALEPCEREGGARLRDAHWQAADGAHPLVGRVFEAGRPINIPAAACERTPLQQLIAVSWDTIRKGGVVLLGEVHDNAEHHAVRGDILWPGLSKVLDTQKLRPAAVFEHLRSAQQKQIDTFYVSASESRRLWGAPDLLQVLNWKETGWPAAEMFHPLFDAALRAKLPIVPGNADRARMRSLVKDASNATTEETAHLDLARSLPPDLVEDLNKELEGSHCGALPKSAFAPMNLAQRYTDAHLAAAAVNAAAEHGGAFLMAGNGHVRTDRGAPWYVRRLAPEKPVTAVMLIEVQEGKTDPAAYLVRGPKGKLTADYVLFTPRQARRDPCEKLRRNKT